MRERKRKKVIFFIFPVMGDDDPKISASAMGFSGDRAPGPFQEYADTAPGPRWRAWKVDLELYLKRNKIVGEDRETWMLSLGGPDIQALNLNLPQCSADEAKGKDKYDQLVLRLDSYFLPKTIFIWEHVKFRNMAQKPNERIDSFIVRLRQQGANCKYGDKLDILILDQLVAKARLKEVRDRLTEKDYTLSEAQVLAASLEMKEAQEKEARANQIERSDEINRISSRSWRGSPQPSRDLCCFACGGSGHWKGSNRCPARDKKCNRCENVGHYEKVCRTRKRRHNEGKLPNSHKGPTVKKEKRSNERTANWIETEEEEDCYNVFCFEGGSADIECLLAEVPVKMLIDSGADVNIINYELWGKICQKRGKIWDAKAGSGGKSLKAYGSEKPLEVKGNFMTKIKIGQREVDAHVYVVDGGRRALLCRRSAQELGVLKLGLEINKIGAEFNKIKGKNVQESYGMI